MKKEIIWNICIFILGMLVATIIWNIPRVKLDTNLDGEVTLSDAVMVINYYTKNKGE